MRALDFAKAYTNFDIIVLVLDESGLSDEQIAELLEITKPTIHNAKKRAEPLLEALKTISDAEPKTYGNPDVNAIVGEFKQQFGTTTVSKYDRFAAKRLFTAHGTENVCNVIRILAHFSDDKYAPAVNDVRQLEEKWVSVGKFLNNKGNGQTVEL